MKVSQWAEIRRLAEVEKLSQRAIVRRLHCCDKTVKKALGMDHPPDETCRPRRGSLLDPFKPKIDALLAKYPELSAVRVLEEIGKKPNGYRGRISLVRDYVRQVRPDRRRVYQEVHYEPAQAMQVDWGECGSVQVGGTKRKVSVFVAALCYIHHQRPLAPPGRQTGPLMAASDTRVEDAQRHTPAPPSVFQGTPSLPDFRPVRG